MMLVFGPKTSYNLWQYSVESVAVHRCTRPIVSAKYPEYSMHGFVWNSDVHHATGQSSLYSTVKSWCLSLGTWFILIIRQMLIKYFWSPTRVLGDCAPSGYIEYHWWSNLRSYGLHEAWDTAQNQSFWKLLASHSDSDHRRRSDWNSGGCMASAEGESVPSGVECG